MDMILLPLIDVTSPSLSLTKSFPIHSSLSLCSSSLLFLLTPPPTRPVQHCSMHYSLSLSLCAWNGEAGRQMRDWLGHARRVTVAKVQCQTYCSMHPVHVSLSVRETRSHKDHTISIYCYYYYVLYGYIHCNAILMFCLYP
jgi:hypothetical protein